MSNQFVTHIITGLNFIFSQMDEAALSLFGDLSPEGALNPHAILSSNHHPEEFENVPFYVHWKDKNSKYIACNKLVAQDVGHNTATMKGSTDFDFHFLSESQIQLYREHDAFVRSTGKAQFFLEPVTRVGGENITTIAYKSPIRLKTNEIIGTKCVAFLFNQKGQTDLNQTPGVYTNPTIFEKTASLSNRQIDCLCYLVKGMTSKQIANRLNLSPRTVEHYINTIKIKWNCTNKAELIARALLNPIVTDRL